MQVILTTDNHIEGSERLMEHVRSVVENALERFGDRVTRVEVHITDESSSRKDTANDKRCVMEARLSGLQPVTVRSQADTVDEALDSAADKLQQTLERTISRRDDPKGRTSFAGE